MRAKKYAAHAAFSYSRNSKPEPYWHFNDAAYAAPFFARSSGLLH